MIQPDSISMTGQYSVVEAAALLEITRRTLYNYINRGVLRAHTRRGSNRRYFTGRELVRFINAK